jgi:peptide methionine sulfoxide reductase msrA/msrB
MDATRRKTTVFASGCFWGTQYQLDKVPGVLRTTVGYTGGHVENPSYEQVCTGGTGHVEAVEVEYDPAVVSYEELAKRFFETHDPTQVDGQGPDRGPQYLSKIFYSDAEEKSTAEKLIRELEAQGLRIATQIEPATRFWPAEDYHQKYYESRGGTPYCHAYCKRF